MSTPLRIDEPRKKAWKALAHHFLDRETRGDLPWTALSLVEAGVSPEDVKEIWRYEVVPAVGANLLSVAGEWAGWDDEWLFETVAEVARRRPHPPSIGSPSGDQGSYWVAIERLMKALLGVDPAVRTSVARDLAALASHYFDDDPRDLSLQRPGRREELRRLYSDVFLPTLGPIALRGECGAQRVEEALR